MSKIMPLSFSRLNTFETCPQKFEYLYVTKQVKDTDNEFTLYGTRVHSALEAYGRAAAGLTDVTQAIEQLEDATPDIAKHYPLVRRIAERPGTKYFEHQLSVRRDHTPCGWFDADVWLRGIADVLVVDGHRAWCLDWKTGKPKSDPTQLQLFAALIFEHFPEVDEVTTSFVWLAHDDITNATHQRRFAPSLWLSLEPRFVRVQESVDLGVFKTKPSGLCPYCPAKGICADAKLRR